MLNAGAVPTVGPDGAMPLHHAAMSAYAPLVVVLLAAGGSVNPRTERDQGRRKSEGWTPLMMCMTDDTEDYELGDAGHTRDERAKYNAALDDLQERQALARALRRTRGDCEVAALLIEAKADLDAKKADGHSALTLTSRRATGWVTDSLGDRPETNSPKP